MGEKRAEALCPPPTPPEKETLHLLIKGSIKRSVFIYEVYILNSKYMLTVYNVENLSKLPTTFLSVVSVFEPEDGMWNPVDTSILIE